MLLTIILWIIVITAFSLFGSWYARKYNKPDALIENPTAPFCQITT